MGGHGHTAVLAVLEGENMFSIILNYELLVLSTKACFFFSRNLAIFLRFNIDVFVPV